MKLHEPVNDEQFFFACSLDPEDVGLHKLEAQWQDRMGGSNSVMSESAAELQQLRSLVQAGIPLVRAYALSLDLES